MSLTKDNLIHTVFEITGFKKTQAMHAVDTALELIKSTLASGEGVLISCFGKFEVREKGSRRGRNPQTGEALSLDARRIVTFKPSSVLKGKLNRRG
jgi:integration host factor subunit alpha